MNTDNHHLDPVPSTDSQDPRVGGSFTHAQQVTVPTFPGPSRSFAGREIGETTCGDHLLDPRTVTVGGTPSQR